MQHKYIYSLSCILDEKFYKKEIRPSHDVIVASRCHASLKEMNHRKFRRVTLHHPGTRLKALGSSFVARVRHRESRGAEEELKGRLFVRHLPLTRPRVRGRWSPKSHRDARACTYGPQFGEFIQCSSSTFPLPMFLPDRSIAKTLLEFTAMNLNEACEPRMWLLFHFLHSYSAANSFNSQ